jgi:hypothetical protein
MTTEQMRAAFEKEARRKGYPLDRDRLTGWYDDRDTSTAWHWWQAAIAFTAPQEPSHGD